MKNAIGNNTLSSKKKIPNKTYPNSQFWNDHNAPLIISEEEKLANDMAFLKKIIRQYEELGRRHIAANRTKIIKNFNLADGIIDKTDYIKGIAELDAEFQLLGGAQDEITVDLEFYPIIPNIVNTLTSVLGKTKINFSAIAVNREAQNEILDFKNKQIQQLLVSSALKFYEGELEAQGITPETQPDVYEEQLKIFQALPKIQKYSSTEFRLTVEQWANHRIENDKRRHNITEISKKAFRNKIVCDRPYIHIDLQDSQYRPTVLKPENCAYLKSPYVDDVSEGYMFMWYEYDSPVSIIQRWGEKMNDEDVEKLRQRYLPTRFTVSTGSNKQFDTQKPIEADIQNFLAFRNEIDTNAKHRGEEYRDNLIEILHMYLQVPRKLYRLHMKIEGQLTSTIVDESYKITFRPIFEVGKGKSVEALIEGEFLEPFYINELYRVSKINFSRNPNPELNHDVWLTLEKYPVQLSNPRIGRFGSYIPVHGGPSTNEYGITNQIVDRCKPWQVFYNFLWNRIYQILETEIGQFFLLNQNAIPQESMDGSWGKNNYLKFLLTARDTGIAPIDTSPSNIGGGNPLAAGFGQKVDMSRTEELLQKVQLAEKIKMECLDVVGASKQLLGDISPNETATGITQGIQRSITQVKYLYDEHYALMEKVHQTMLELAKYQAIQNNGADETYIADENERVIFQTDAANFTLYDLGVYATSSFDDTLLLAEYKNLVRMDNTMGADLQEKFSMMSSESIADVHKKLKDIQARKEAQMQKQQEEETKRTQMALESQEKQKAQQIEWEREKLLLTIESNENIQEMKVIGQSQFGQGSGIDELIKYKNTELDKMNYYQSILDKAKQADLTQQRDQANMESNRVKEENKTTLEREKLQLKREELLARLKISKDQLAIAKENKP
jgi:hypothetical protein